MPFISVGQAALEALARWLAASLPDVVVSPRWPDATPDLGVRALSIIYAGARDDVLIDPRKVGEDPIHAAVSARIVADPATDLPSAIVALNLARASYEAHRGDLTAHVAADTTDAITAPIATDQDSAVALALDLFAKIPAHDPSAAHAHPDQRSALPGLATPSPSTLFASADAIVNDLNRHYATRIDTWAIRGCRQPVQLDVWTTYDVDRDDLEARLEPLLNTSTLTGGDPVRNGCLVALADVWTDACADFLFDAPRPIQTGDAVQRQEFRLTYAGSVDFNLVVKAQAPRLADIRAVIYARALPPPSAAPASTVSVTPSGVTYS